MRAGIPRREPAASRHTEQWAAITGGLPRELSVDAGLSQNAGTDEIGTRIETSRATAPHEAREPITCP
ncbi:hypothetical protein GCM10010442_33700 [Kitasatospora kifunensis]